MREFVIERLSRSAEETADFAAQFARALIAAGADSPALLGEAQGPVVVFLKGDLGSGKTTFAQGFIRGCGISDSVRSPTYALLEPYEAEHLTLVHLDLYRLRDPAELEALGLRDWMMPNTVWLIEWPERAAGRLPAPDLRLSLSVEEDAHRLEAESEGALGRRWLRNIDAA